MKLRAITVGIWLLLMAVLPTLLISVTLKHVEALPIAIWLTLVTVGAVAIANSDY